MNSHRAQVALALRAIAVTSATSYAWFGYRSQPLAPGMAAAISHAAAREYLIGRIQAELYRSFYGQGRPVPFDPDPGPASSDRALVDALSAANAGRGGWEAGWRVVGAGADLVVERDGLRVWVDPSDCRPRGAAHAEGMLVSVRRPKEYRAGSPGFYTALGDTLPSISGDETEVRVYFSITAAGAVPLVATATRLLNGEAVPFVLKLLDHPLRYSRTDAAVLYLRKDDFTRARGALGAVEAACGAHRREHSPVFAKPLARGVAVGEHRRELGDSFGTLRCRLVAEGVVTAHEEGATQLEDRLEAVARRFEDNGLDLDVPYLVTRSADGYAL